MGPSVFLSFFSLFLNTKFSTTILQYNAYPDMYLINISQALMWETNTVKQNFMDGSLMVLQIGDHRHQDMKQKYNENKLNLIKKLNRMISML